MWQNSLQMRSSAGCFLVASYSALIGLQIDAAFPEWLFLALVGDEELVEEAFDGGEHMLKQVAMVLVLVADHVGRALVLLLLGHIPAPERGADSRRTVGVVAQRGKLLAGC